MRPWMATTPRRTDLCQPSGSPNDELQRTRPSPESETRTGSQDLHEVLPTPASRQLVSAIGAPTRLGCQSPSPLPAIQLCCQRMHGSAASHRSDDGTPTL